MPRQTCRLGRLVRGDRFIWVATASLLILLFVLAAALVGDAILRNQEKNIPVGLNAAHHSPEAQVHTLHLTTTTATSHRSTSLTLVVNDLIGR